MKKEELLKYRKKLQAEQAAAKNEVDRKWTIAVKAYIAENCEFKVGQVVEATNRKSRKFKRMAIYDIATKQIFENHLSICLYGWYLDANDNPFQWEGSGLYLDGISNPDTIVLSVNQNAEPVPNSLS